MVKGVGYRMSTRLVEFTRFATAPPPSLPREKRYLLEIEFAAYLDNRESRSTWRLVLQFADVRGYTILARRKSLFLSRPAPSLCRSSSREAFVSGSTPCAYGWTRKNEPFSKDVGGFGLRESSLEKEREREGEGEEDIFIFAPDSRRCSGS